MGGGKIPYSGEDLGVMEQSLEDRANCLQLWFMSYLNPLLSLGSRKVLENSDVGVPSAEDRAERAYTCAKAAWDEQVELCRIHNAPLIEKKKEQDALLKEHEEAGTPLQGKHKPAPIVLKEPSVMVALVNSFGMGKFLAAIFFQIVSSLLGFVPVLILNDLVRYFEFYAYRESAMAAGNLDEGVVEFRPLVNPWLQVVGLGIVPLL
eukprot:jgi/Psemu1/191448/e_gw1.114.36.1